MPELAEKNWQQGPCMTFQTCKSALAETYRLQGGTMTFSPAETYRQQGDHIIGMVCTPAETYRRSRVYTRPRNARPHAEKDRQQGPCNIFQNYINVSAMPAHAEKDRPQGPCNINNGDNGSTPAETYRLQRGTITCSLAETYQQQGEHTDVSATRGTHQGLPWDARAGWQYLATKG